MRQTPFILKLKMLSDYMEDVGEGEDEIHDEEDDELHWHDDERATAPGTTRTLDDNELDKDIEWMFVSTMEFKTPLLG